MQIYVLGSDRKLIGVVESFEYFSWTRRYFSCGAFELKAIATSENIELLKIGNYIRKSDDGEAGIIEYLKMSMDDTEFITVKGRFATALLSRRIVWGTETLSGNISDCVEQLLKNHLINPTNSERAISFISYSNDGLTDSISTQVSYKNLMDTVTTLCETADIGIKTSLDISTGIFTVKLYKGEMSQAVFSREYENLIGQTYTKSAADYANTALVGGKGEGTSRVLEVAGGGFDENRREVFVDAKDLSTDDLADDYTAALLYRGQNKLSDLAMTQSFDSEINTNGNLKYKTDFDLGQTVKIISKKWGISLTARITEVEETYDSDGQSIAVTFGKGALSLMQKLTKGDI